MNRKGHLNDTGKEASNTLLCPRCGGMARVSQRDAIGEYTAPCNFCKGTGKVLLTNEELKELQPRYTED